MDQSLFQLAAAAGYGEARLAVLANNLANVNTPGFKADQVHFSEVLNDLTEGPDVRMGQFIELHPGPIEQTGNPLDVAIQGDGFFMVDTPAGQRFTRDGSFRIGEAGLLITSEGHPVSGANGPIAIDPAAGQVTITENGTVIAGDIPAGTIELFEFADPSSLRKLGGNLFSGLGQTPVENPRVMQGAIERSNVESVVEMTRMIEISRGYETYQKLIQAMDQVASQTNEMGA